MGGEGGCGLETIPLAIHLRTEEIDNTSNGTTAQEVAPSKKVCFAPPTVAAQLE